MLSTNNILSPAHGTPIVTPTQDMILGTYYLTMEPKGVQAAGDGQDGNGKVRTFGSVAEALLAYDFGQVTLQQPVKVRLRGKLGPGESLDDTDPEPSSLSGSNSAAGFDSSADATSGADGVPEEGEDEDGTGTPSMPLIDTTVGRLIFNEAMPGDFPYINRVVGKRELS